VDLDSVGDGGSGSANLPESRGSPSATADLASDLAADLEQLGPTFVKLGQLLSTRADLLPVPYLEALARLQDDVAPFGFDEVEPIVTGELGVRLSKAFSYFDPEPIAAASLGQVRRAALRDGRSVAVKVQHPNIQKQIVEDLEALLELAGVIERHTQVGRRVALKALVDQFRRSLISELDYRPEAPNLDLLAGNMAGFDHIVVPRPVGPSASIGYSRPSPATWR
jgi:ubiquinone biosynthesis protein